MAYGFKRSDRGAAQGVRRIAAERLDESLAILAAAAPPDAAALHTLRKNVKKLRGLLRLVQPVFDGFKREDAALRDAGRAISALRDRAVMLALLEALATREELAAAPARALRDAPGPDTPRTDPDAALAAHRAALQAVRARVDDWRFGGRGFDRLAPGLVRSVEQARRALKRWRRARDDVALHQLRKCIKAHGYHTLLLEAVWPEMMRPRARALDRLGEILGDARDRRLLAARLDTVDGGATLAARARAEAAVLERKGELLARRLLAEKGKALARRWATWWRLWRG